MLGLSSASAFFASLGASAWMLGRRAARLDAGGGVLPSSPLRMGDRPWKAEERLSGLPARWGGGTGPTPNGRWNVESDCVVCQVSSTGARAWDLRGKTGVTLGQP